MLVSVSGAGRKLPWHLEMHPKTLAWHCMLLGVCLLLLPPASAAQPTGQDADEGRDGATGQATGWSEPRPLWPEARHPLFQIDVARTDSALYVVGNGASDPFYRVGPTRPFFQPVSDTTRLRIRRLEGEDLSVRKRFPIPPFDNEYGYPALVAGTDGTLHLVWGEPNPDSLRKARSLPDTTSSEAVPTLVTRSLHHSVYREGRWRAPREVFGPPLIGEPGYPYDPDTLRGDPIQPTIGWEYSKSPLTAGPEGRLRLTFGTTGYTPLDAAPRHFRYIPGQGWQDRSPPKSDFPTSLFGLAYVEAAFSPDGTVYLSAVGAVPDGRNSLAFARARRRGQKWTEVALLEHSGGNQIYDHHLLRANNGTLHLLRYRDTDQFSIGIVEHVRSTDGGRTWSEPEVIEIPEKKMTASIESTAVLAPNGTIHLAVRDNRKLWHARWDGASWSGGFRQVTGSTRKSTEETWVADPVLAVGPSGEALVLVWTRPSSRNPEDGTAVYATWSLRQ